MNEPLLEADDPEAGHAGLMGDLIMALRFFSRLPTGASAHLIPDLGRIAVVLALASLVIGIGPALLLVGGAMVGLPIYFAAALAVGAMALVSGAMAEDALADAMDGLFGGHTIERRLEIMKDSRHGTYGVTALALFILLRVTALGAMAAVDPLMAGALWLAASIAGRSGALWLAAALPPVRREGASAAAGQVSMRSFAMGTVLAVVIAALLVVPMAGPAALGVAVLLGLVVVAGWTALCRRLVGGQTGDLIGALVGLVEIAVLAALVGFVQ